MTPAGHVCRIASALLLLALAGGGCTSISKKPDYGDNEGVQAGTRREVIRSLMFEFGDYYAGSVEAAADRIIDETDDPRVRRNALLWKINGISVFHLASFRPDPLPAIVDSYTLIVQMREFFDTGAGRDVFGAQQHIARETMDDLYSRIYDIVENIAVDVDYTVGEVDNWVATHPIEGMHFNRETMIPGFAHQERKSTDVVESVVTLENLALELSGRLSTYAAHLPKEARWQAELFREDLIQDEMVDLWTREYQAITDAAVRTADVAEKIPGLVDDEFGEILETIPRERMKLLQAIAAERVALIEAISEQRRAVLDAIRAERESVISAIDTQRRETIDVVLEALRVERQALVELAKSERTATLADIERITMRAIADADSRTDSVVNHLFWDLILYTIGCVVLAPFVALVYRRILIGPRGQSRS